jgi:hypothetical protein
MSSNADKVRCTHLTRAGRPCRGWAVRGSDPPACPSHFHAHVPDDAPERVHSGTQATPENARPSTQTVPDRACPRPPDLKQVAADPAGSVESFYTPVLSRQELADLVTYTAEMTLADEIACARAAVRRTLEFLSRGPEAVSESHYLRAVGLVHQGTRAIAQLLRDQQALGGSVSEQLQAIIDAALDDLSEEWGVEL